MYLLEEELRNVKYSSSQMDLISSLTKKVSEYESIVIPKLKEQIMRHKEQLRLQPRYDSPQT